MSPIVSHVTEFVEFQAANLETSNYESNIAVLPLSTGIGRTNDWTYLAEGGTKFNFWLILFQDNDSSPKVGNNG